MVAQTRWAMVSRKTCLDFTSSFDPASAIKLDEVDDFQTKSTSGSRQELKRVSSNKKG